MSQERESLLIFSDVHLGSDLNDAGPAVRRSAAIDRDLALLLAHYRRRTPPSGRWKIVIAGDFIDFVGMAVDPGKADELDTTLTAEERLHGVGGAEDHARLKLRRVATRHAEVFAELAAFVADGHALTLVHGNHDIEFHWDAVKTDFRALLLAALPAAAAVDAAAFMSRIEFSPWFFYREGVVYVEHGHQYDPFCATAHLMAPVSPLDPRRVTRAFSDVMLRFVVRRTRGMSEHGHEHKGLASYITFALSLGISGMAGLAGRFARGIIELLRIRREYLSDATKAIREEHERRVAQLAEATRIGRDRLRDLLALQATPIGHSLAGILASSLLDRLAIGATAVATLLLVGTLAVAGVMGGHAIIASVGVLLAWGLAHTLLSRRRSVDPAARMEERAARLVKLFPAAFVVMGHTHVPMATHAGGATYINLGSWIEEETDPVMEARGTKGFRAARTHLVIHADGKSEANLYEWRADEGPRVRLTATADAVGTGDPT